jgi:hypothetical protein
VPNQPATPNRSVRCPDEVWLPAKAKAEDNGETITDVVNRLLKEYAADYRARGY